MASNVSPTASPSASPSAGSRLRKGGKAAAPAAARKAAPVVVAPEAPVVVPVVAAPVAAPVAAAKPTDADRAALVASAEAAYLAAINAPDAERSAATDAALVALRKLAPSARALFVLEFGGAQTMAAITAGDMPLASRSAQVQSAMTALLANLPASPSGKASDPAARLARFLSGGFPLALAVSAHAAQAARLAEGLSEAQVAEAQAKAQAAWDALGSDVREKRVASLVGGTGEKVAVNRDYRPLNGQALSFTHLGTTHTGTVVADPSGDGASCLVEFTVDGKAERRNPTRARRMLTGEKAVNGPEGWSLADGRTLGAAAAL